MNHQHIWIIMTSSSISYIHRSTSSIFGHPVSSLKTEAFWQVSKRFWVLVVPRFTSWETIRFVLLSLGGKHEDFTRQFFHFFRRQVVKMARMFFFLPVPLTFCCCCCGCGCCGCCGCCCGGCCCCCCCDSHFSLFNDMFWG